MLKTAVVALLGICLVLTGCSTTHYIPFNNLKANESPALSPGDTVRVTLKSGQIRRLKVAAADAQTITGLDLDKAHSGISVQIALADVQTLQVREYEGGRTFWLVAGIVAIVAAAMYASAISELDSGY
jgi:hypothetical protein